MINKPHLALDSYKVGHIAQYPKGTELVYSNLTARSATHANMPSSFDNKVVFVGLQAFCLEFLIEEWNTGFFNRPKSVVVAEYKRRVDTFLGPDSVDVSHIAALHDLGYLPIAIKALPEGSRVDIKVPFLTVYNTLPAFFWLTNYIETVMSNELWKMCTTATIAFEYRRILNKYVELTGSDSLFADWQIHDFSMRGMSGYHDAAKSGLGHLFAAGYGSDTLPAVDYAEQYYGANPERELVAGSVPATEHSVICMGGMTDEVETFRRLITETYPSGIVSIVSDTWDFWNVITKTAATLKPEILARKENALGQAKVVFRPDSGDPVKIITGLKVKNVQNLFGDEAEALYYDYKGEEFDVVHYNGKCYKYDTSCDRDEYDHSPRNYQIDLLEEVPEHVVKGAVECLWDIYGGDTTDKGYKTLNQRVGLIYGDSITLARAEAILSRLMAKGFSAGNIVFGVGSYTYQMITRDTFGMAMKATFGIVNGEKRELFKDPATGDGVKKSAKGLLRVEKEGDKFVLYDQQTEEQEVMGALELVFQDSVMFRKDTYAGIKDRIKGS